MDQLALYLAFVNFGKQDFPGFEVRYKNETWWMRWVAFVIKPFNPRFMTDFTTNIGNKVYFPTREGVERDPLGAWKTLAHEFVHMEDRRRYGRLKFGLMYAAPQWLVFPALLLCRILDGPWWSYLLALLFLLPLPAYYRKQLEMRGYAMSMAVNHWRYGSVREYTRAWVCEQFTGPSYYFMWPFSKNVRNTVSDIESRLKTGQFVEKFTAATARSHEENQIFRDVHKLLKALGAVEEG